MVKADAGKIDGAGKTISGLKSDLDSPKQKVDAIDVKPGDFPVANTLKTTVGKRAKEASKFSTEIGGEVEEIGGKLHKISTDVNDTENDNLFQAKGVSNSVDSAKSGA